MAAADEVGSVDELGLQRREEAFATALSQQSPLRLMLQTMPCGAAAPYSALAYWTPRSECERAGLGPPVFSAMPERKGQAAI